MHGHCSFLNTDSLHFFKLIQSVTELLWNRVREFSPNDSQALPENKENIWVIKICGYINSHLLDNPRLLCYHWNTCLHWLIPDSSKSGRPALRFPPGLHGGVTLCFVSKEAIHNRTFPVEARLVWSHPHLFTGLIWLLQCSLCKNNGFNIYLLDCIYI